VDVVRKEWEADRGKREEEVEGIRNERKKKKQKSAKPITVRS
jgi:hypothetical protein